MRSCSMGKSKRMELSEMCDGLVERALAEHDAFHRQQANHRWNQLKQNATATTYIDHGTSEWTPTEPGWRTFLTSGIIPGTIDEILTGYYADTSEAFRIASTIYNPRLLDCGILQVFQSNTIDAPVVLESTKWIAMKLAIIPRLLDRESFVYERIGRAVDDHGTEFGYVVDVPIDHEGLGLPRTNFVVVRLFRALETGGLGVFTITKSIAPAYAISKIGEVFLDDQGAGMFNHVIIARAKALSTFMMQAANESLSVSPTCDFCNRAPSILSKLHNCSGCRKRTCHRCRQMHVIFQLQVRSRKPKKALFCKNCLEAAQCHLTASNFVVDSHWNDNISSSAISTDAQNDFSIITDLEASSSDEAVSVISNVSSTIRPAESISSDQNQLQDARVSAQSPNSYRPSEAERELSRMLGQMLGSGEKNASWNGDDRLRFSLKYAFMTE